MEATFEGGQRCRRPRLDQVVDHLQLLLAAAVLAGADVAAFDRAAELLLGLLAAVAGLVEERLFTFLGTSEGIVGRARRRRGQRARLPPRIASVAS